MKFINCMQQGYKLKKTRHPAHSNSILCKGNNETWWLICDQIRGQPCGICFLHIFTWVRQGWEENKTSVLFTSFFFIIFICISVGVEMKLLKLMKHQYKIWLLMKFMPCWVTVILVQCKLLSADTLNHRYHCILSDFQKNKTKKTHQTDELRLSKKRGANLQTSERMLIAKIVIPL